MSNIVFTGKCDILNRVRMMRPALTRMAGRAGFTVLGSITRRSNVRYLVASRMDTRKAQSARDMGVEVITYRHFFDICETEMSNQEEPMNESRIHRHLPVEDAGRMAPEEDFRGRPLGTPKTPYQRQTAIGGKRLRRALDLG